ncbi:MAG: hypothetical protein K0R61_299 [Microvirga sp.]|nr:hypothetical protein [Thermomicrobiales bacterium]MDF2969849.1 hypothetical protein [Microvirga sp.]
MDGRDRVRTIVILADGTGNAFKSQESNIWRLYAALDLTSPEQVAYYIKGVGTSGFKPLALLDGAIGFGVPANVRKLYRFLCWNWHPEVEIYLFGFSRGAFTVRTLIGLIDSQGLVPIEFEDGPVSREEMKRNVMAAWRAYRARKATWSNSLPTIPITRAIRDLILSIYQRLRGHRRYAEIRETMRTQKRIDARIRFVGLFDTVEAYGVPIEEMRTAIDFAIWPISFRNRVLSQKVDFARHALALDDERTTFHPLRFDMTNEPEWAKDGRIKEVWFSGVHSDVGGGYPEGALSYVPLAWMADEIAATASGPNRGLRFLPGALHAFREQASALAAKHDSREGLSVLYRYDPRPIGGGPDSGGPPVIHHSVAEKMVFGTENYAPLTLPQNAYVLMPDGARHPIEGFDDQHYRDAVAPARGVQPASVHTVAADAVERLNEPKWAFVELTQDAIWWRRVAYFILFACVLALICLPLTAPWLSSAFAAALQAIASVFGLEDLAKWAQGGLNDARDGLRSNLYDLSTTVGGFVPGYAKGWLGALVDEPLGAFAIISVTLLFYSLNSSLRDRIADHARCAWFFKHQAGQNPPAEPGLLASFARGLRRSRVVGSLRRLVARFLVPALTLAVIVGLAAVLVGRAVLTYRSGTGEVCKETASEDLLRHPKEGVANLAEGFRTSNPCWGTGIFVAKGRLYRVWIEMAEPFLDGGKVVEIAGFTDASLRHFVGLPLRRWWAADWFQPIARIGIRGNVEWALQATDGAAPRELGDNADIPDWERSSVCEKAPSGMDGEIAAIQRRLSVRKSFTTQFVAAATGELFLFVNDAMTAVPFGPSVECFYANNRGAAKVTVELVASPQPPPPQGYDFPVK